MADTKSSSGAGFEYRDVYRGELSAQSNPVSGAFERDVRNTLTELGDLLIKKHEAYGPKNISQAPGGPENGLRVRMWDKMARLNHIIENPGVDVNDESIEDTLKDLANYCIIFTMVRRNKWPAE